jgi:NTP pyrophosphatase (non-canonical NTP hydrolase)
MIDKKEKDELLTIFMEECAEATVEASKLIRFGSDTFCDVYKMEAEIGDLLCMVSLLDEYGIINLNEVERHKKVKREKLKKWSDLTKL